MAEESQVPSTPAPAPLPEKRVESALPEGLWRSLVAAMLEPVIAIDVHGTIVHANPACERAFGHAPRELTGQKVDRLMPEPYASEHDGYLERYRGSGEARILGRPRELPVLRRDGSLLWCEISIAEVRLAGRQEPFFCASFRDLTRTREALSALSRSEARFRAIFEQEGEFVCLLDGDGRLVDANPAALNDIGGRLDRWRGRPFDDLPWWTHEPAERERVHAALEQALSGVRVRLEVVDGLVPGGHRHLDVVLSGLNVEAGRAPLVLLEVRDVSELVLAREQQQAMDRTFAQIGESAALLAHEIKSPLTSLNLALRAVAGQLGADEQALLDDLALRLGRLQELATRTLSLARPVELRLAPCAPGPLLEAARRDLAPDLEAANVRVEIDVDPSTPQVSADGTLIAEVLTNLIRNALEALGSRGLGGCLRLAARACPGGARLVVEDDGPGIPESERDRVFQPFVTTHKQGSGLGLALVRKVVEAHGGAITAGSSSLGGARIEFVLPAAAAARHAAQSKPDPRPEPEADLAEPRR